MAKTSTLRLCKLGIKSQQVEFVFDVNGHKVTSGYAFDFNLNQEIELNNSLLRKYVLYAALSYAPMLFRLDYFDEFYVEFPMSNQEAEFFEDLIFKGLAELRYTCGIDITKKTRLTPNSYIEANTNESKAKPRGNRALGFLGGGKDGLVAAETLHRLNQPFDVFILNPHEFRKKQLDNWEDVKLYSARRLKRRGAENLQTKNDGHNPLSAELAALGHIVALTMGHKYISVANEYSANFPNLTENGVSINHQYTKSFEYEIKLQSLYRSSFKNSPYYFSLLRPLYEFQIMKIFSNSKRLNSGFSSCNQVSAEGGWCLDCPKCAYIILTMWAVDPKQAKRLWGDSVFQPQNMYLQLLALINGEAKPLECVGTLEESRYAAYLAHENLAFKNLDSDQRLEILEYASINVEKNHKTMSNIDRDNSFPSELSGSILSHFRQELEIE